MPLNHTLDAMPRLKGTYGRSAAAHAPEAAPFRTVVTSARTTSPGSVRSTNTTKPPGPGGTRHTPWGHHVNTVCHQLRHWAVKRGEHILELRSQGAGEQLYTVYGCVLSSLGPQFRHCATTFLMLPCVPRQGASMLTRWPPTPVACAACRTACRALPCPTAPYLAYLALPRPTLPSMARRAHSSSRTCPTCTGGETPPPPPAPPLRPLPLAAGATAWTAVRGKVADWV